MILFEGPISIDNFSTTSKKNSFLEYLIPYCLQETTFDICRAASMALVCVFLEKGFESS
jgi:hypothetical protein